MIKKFLLAMEPVTEELTVMMKSKCKTFALTIHLRGAVQKTQLIAPPIQELTEKHLLLKEQMNINDSVDEKFQEEKQTKGGGRYLKVNFQNGTQKILHLMLL